MKRYFFDTEARMVVHLDDVGALFAGDDDAYADAMRTIVELARNALDTSREVQSLLITVRNAVGVAIFDVELTATLRWGQARPV